MLLKYAVHYHLDGDSLPYKYNEVITNDIKSWIKKVTEENQAITVLEYYPI